MRTLFAPGEEASSAAPAIGDGCGAVGHGRVLGSLDPGHAPESDPRASSGFMVPPFRRDIRKANLQLLHKSLAFLRQADQE